MKIRTSLDFQGNEIKLATPEKVNTLPNSNLFIGRTCILISDNVGSVYYYNGEQWCNIEGESLKIDETKINVIDDEITLHTFDTLSDIKTYIDSNNKPKSVIIGSNASITSIGEGAFWNCTSLTSINIPSSVTSIGSGAFSSCTSLASINIPSSVTSIGSGAFNGCTSLKSVNIPDSVTIIIDGAFSGCTSLASITIPNGVTSIGSGAFSNCTSLTSITIPDSVTSIGGSAFWNCTSLTSITIPNGVTSIGSMAFFGCDILLLDNYKSKIGYPWGATNILIQNEDVTTTIDENSTDRQVPTAKTVYQAFGGKVDKIAGKGLSTEDYTTEEKNKLSGIASGAEVNVQSDWNQTDSSADDFIKNKPAIPTVDQTFDATSPNAQSGVAIASVLGGGSKFDYLLHGVFDSEGSQNIEPIPPYEDYDMVLIRIMEAMAVTKIDIFLIGKDSSCMSMLETAEGAKCAVCCGSVANFVNVMKKSTASFHVDIIGIKI